MRRLWTATARLVAVHLAFTFLATALVLSVVHQSTIGLIEAESDERTLAELHGLAELYGTGGISALRQGILRRLVDPHAAANAYLVVDADGQSLAGNLFVWPDEEPIERLIGPGALTVHRTDLKLFRTDESRWAVIRAVTTDLAGGERLLVGRDVLALAQSETVLGRTFLLGLVLILGTGALTGWGLTRLILRRIDEVSVTARRVMDGELSTRVPDHDLGNEFDRLAGVLNAMFDRIETLLTDLRVATDSLAHDLRSPLSRLRNHLNQALAADLPPGDRDLHIARSLREADEMLKMLSALLEISRAQAGVGRDQFTELDLSRLVHDVADLFEPLADANGLSLRIDAPGPVRIVGHEQLLFLALSNLLDNALRFTAPATEVCVSVVAGDAGVTLSVADRGPGIPADQRERVIQRFVRLEQNRGGGGAGLGLALVAAIAAMHRAELVLSDHAPGLIASLRFTGAGAGNA